MTSTKRGALFCLSAIIWLRFRSLCGVGMLLEHGKLRSVGPVARVISEYALGLRETSGRNRDSLGSSLLELGRLDFSPSRRSKQVAVQCHSIFRSFPKEATVIKEMAVLVYSEYGVRVAVLDMRREGLRDMVLSIEPLGFRDSH